MLSDGTEGNSEVFYGFLGVSFDANSFLTTDSTLQTKFGDNATSSSRNLCGLENIDRGPRGLLYSSQPQLPSQ